MKSQIKQQPELLKVFLITLLGFLIIIPFYFIAFEITHRPFYNNLIYSFFYTLIISGTVYYILNHYKYKYSKIFALNIFSIFFIFHILDFLLYLYNLLGNYNKIFITISRFDFLLIIASLLLCLKLIRITNNKNLWKYMFFPLAGYYIISYFINIVFYYIGFPHMAVDFIQLVLMATTFALSLFWIIDNADKKAFGEPLRAIEFNNINFLSILLYALAIIAIIVLKLAWIF